MTTPKKPTLPKPCKAWGDIIQRQVSYFNGWRVSKETERRDCEKAAYRIMRSLRRKALKLPAKELKRYIVEGIIK